MSKPIEIDFVLPWVDSTKPCWRKQYEEFAPLNIDGDSREIRFRDWELLPYWFRAIEAYAPWVRKIHFVTSGELPEWLNLDHHKLHWVKHEDFIPSQYLPTFNVNVIETNIHRIQGLSEHFVYFNDDMFLLKEAHMSDFFKNGLPCDCAILDPIIPKEVPEFYVNDILAINRHFDKGEVIRKNCSKWINPTYGKFLIRTLLLLPWKRFPGLLVTHLPQAFKKETFALVWEVESELLHATCTAKFRSHTNVNQWLFHFWHLVQGRFTPSNIMEKGKNFEISDATIEQICAFIANRKMKQICINDGIYISYFEILRDKLKAAFQHILPQKSEFEK